MIPHRGAAKGLLKSSKFLSLSVRQRLALRRRLSPSRGACATTPPPPGPLSARAPDRGPVVFCLLFASRSQDPELEELHRDRMLQMKAREDPRRPPSPPAPTPPGPLLSPPS